MTDLKNLTSEADLGLCELDAAQLSSVDGGMMKAGGESQFPKPGYGGGGGGGSLGFWDGVATGFYISLWLL
jgi:hypothetical protein